MTPAQDLTALADKLDELAMKATPTPWEADSEKDEHGMLFATMSSSVQPFYALFDSMNADYRVVSCEREYDDEGGAIHWDETARRNFALIVSLVNNLATLTTALREAARMREALEKIQTVADNERMDATDTHYAVMMAGIQATARAALEGPHG